jgi:hypothetical protein
VQLLQVFSTSAYTASIDGCAICDSACLLAAMSDGSYIIVGEL